MAKAIPWSEWVGISQEKLVWIFRYLDKNDVQISCPPKETLGKKHVIATFREMENDPQGREILKRMKATHAAKKLRRSKRFKGYVSTTIGMTANTKDKLIELQKELACTSQEETIEYLIHNADSISEKIDSIYKEEIRSYKDRIKDLEKGKGRRSYVKEPLEGVAAKIQNTSARLDLRAEATKFFAELERDRNKKLDEFIASLAEVETDENDQEENTKDQSDQKTEDDPSNPPTTAS